MIQPSTNFETNGSAKIRFATAYPYWVAPTILLLLFGWTVIGTAGESAGAAIPTAATFSQSDPSSTTDGSIDEESDDSSVERASLFQQIFGGNTFGVVVVVLIMLLSLVATFLIIEHSLTITRRKLLPEDVLGDVEQRISRGEIAEAMMICRDGENHSLATEVILAGLERYQSSEFGFAEYRTAVEEAGEDQTGRLYRKTEVLNVIGSIAPMLGLTGTVIGMIDAFNTIAAQQGMARPEQLAGGIGQALITTLLGLVVAIPSMVAFSFFRNKIDSLVAEAGKRTERVMMPLGRKRQ